MRTSSVSRRACWALSLSLLSLALLPSAARTEGLEKFTGYTRPGHPSGPPGPIKPASNAPEDTPIGATMYFKVYELGDGVPGDPWGTGFGNLESFFVPGQASRGRGSDRLDTTARYLYLYQAVNDSERDGQVKSAAVRLLVEPHYITSWGHFAQQRQEAGRGVSFAADFSDAGKGGILPVSTAHPAVSDRLYRDPAPYFNSSRLKGLSSILLGNAPVPQSAEGEDTGVAPERVVLQATSNFEKAPIWLERDQVQLTGLAPNMRLVLPYSDLYNPYYNPLNPVAPVAADGLVPGFGLGTNTTPNLYEALRRAPAVVAFWSDYPLRPRQRSTLFGFTSNQPPVYEDVRLRGNGLPDRIVPAAPAPDIRPANTLADGEVPTPVAFEPVVPAGGGGPTGGSLGNPGAVIGGGGGLLRGGGGMGGGGMGGGFPGILGGGGGGTGGGTGGGVGGGGTTGPGTTGTGTTSIPASLLALLSPTSPTTPTGNNSNSNGSNSNSNGNNTNSGTGTGTGTNSNNNTNGGANQTTIVNVQQQQGQQQQQQQKQKQQQSQQQMNNCCQPGNVVPEPTALVPALLGLPFLVVLLLRWRKAVPVPAN
jgi:hypothetical protein